MENTIGYQKDDVVTRAMAGLGGFVSSTIIRSIETIRIARALYALLESGCAVRAPIVQKAKKHIASLRREDGGWSDPEETAWAVAVLSQEAKPANSTTTQAHFWLQSVRHSAGGWGRHERDIPRIPTTALVMTLVPGLKDTEALQWMNTEWSAEMAGPVQLSYKAGFFLLATQGEKSSNNTELLEQTIVLLTKAQNDDGGFGPWKNHPIGSDPWSTGIVLWGLSQWAEYVKTEVFERSLAWLRITQLDSGFWPYHYLDDGTSMALIGAVKALKVLAEGS